MLTGDVVLINLSGEFFSVFFTNVQDGLPAQSIYASMFSAGPVINIFWILSSKLLAVPFTTIKQNDGHDKLIRYCQIK